MPYESNRIYNADVVLLQNLISYLSLTCLYFSLILNSDAFFYFNCIYFDRKPKWINNRKLQDGSCEIVMHDLKESKVFLELSICYAVKYKMWYNSSIKKHASVSTISSGNTDNPPCFPFQFLSLFWFLFLGFSLSLSFPVLQVIDALSQSSATQLVVNNATRELASLSSLTVVIVHGIVLI